MTKRRTLFERLISLLLGASWALALVGGVSFFSLFSPFGLITAFIAGFIGSLAGLFFVVLCEMAHIQSQKLYELKKQSKLLEKIDEKLSDN